MPTLSTGTFRRIADLMHASIGVSFNPSKQLLISSRLAPRLQQLGLESFEEYVDRIESVHEGGEFQMAVDLLTTNETYFFREPEHFELLERELPSFGRRPISVWSAASSYGDEAYSTAMLLADLVRHGRIDPEWSVLGTDVSDRVLRAARDGVFPADRLRKVSPERLRRYCLRGEGESEGLVQIQPLLAERVRFGRLNLCEPIDPPGPFDVIFLRNVLIYFDVETKRRVVDRVLHELRPGGLFFIGLAEGRVGTGARLQPLAPGAFRKLAA